MTSLLCLLLPHSRRVALAVALGAIVIASNMGLLAAAAYLIAAASVMHLMALLIIPMYAVRILSATRGCARYAERLVAHRVTFDVLASLRVRLYDQLRRLGPSGTHGVHSGDVLSRAMADVESLQSAFLLFVSPIAVALVVSVALLEVLAAFSTAIAWTTLVYLVTGGILLPATVGLISRGPGRALVAARAELNARLVDTIQGSRDIVSNGAGPRFLERAASEGRRMAHAESRLAVVTAGKEALTELLPNLAMLTALGLAVPLVTHREISGLYVAVPALLTLAAFEAIRPLGQAAETAGVVRATGRRVLSIDRGVKQMRESATALRLEPPYSVSFEGVTLAYPDTGRPALLNVTFGVPPGSRVAVVGPSGAGKTTLVRLLTRAWDPEDGRVVVGGKDVRDYSLHDLRAALGVVAQDTYIFNDTIRNNLLLARPGASPAELEWALEEVGLIELIRGLPHGLDTWVGEHGNQLSGGERQRLAVARVLLQDAPIIVLDEVTANLDPVTESALLDMLHRVTEDRSAMFITHRLVGLERMDEIVVLDRGRVTERGTHERLYAAGGTYRRMLVVQENMLAV